MDSLFTVGGALDKVTVDLAVEAIERVLTATSAHRNPEVTLKALGVLSSSLSVSADNTQVMNCTFTNNEPREEEEGLGDIPDENAEMRREM